MLLLPLGALAAVVGFAVVGGHREATIDRPAAIAVAVPAPTSAPVASVIAGLRSVATPVPHVTTRREQGTDGLMGRIPFGLPDDMPTVRVIERHDRFVTDDVVRTWSDSSGDGPTPAFRVRVLGPNSDAYVL
jgi:hypothetical protein